MQFFVPGCVNEAITEETYKSIKDYAVSTFRFTILEKRVHSIAYYNPTGGNNFTAEVGKVNYDNGELVVSILETDNYFLVCTPTAGVVSGSAMLINRKEIIGSSYFDS
jgi:hypothetical protein